MNSKWVHIAKSQWYLTFIKCISSCTENAHNVMTFSVQCTELLPYFHHMMVVTLHVKKTTPSQTYIIKCPQGNDKFVTLKNARINITVRSRGWRNPTFLNIGVIRPSLFPWQTPSPLARMGLWSTDAPRETKKFKMASFEIKVRSR